MTDRDQPLVQLAGQRQILARVTDEDPGHRPLPTHQQQIIRGYPGQHPQRNPTILSVAIG
jgi:hypothetical protein